MTQQSPGSDWQNIEITFGKLDTKTDPPLLPAGGLTLAENASTQTDGIYTKRNGYTALAGVLTSCMRLGVLGTQLLACGGLALSTYDASGGTWHNAGLLPAATISQSSVILDQSNNVVRTTTAVAAGVRVDAWIDETNQFVTVQLSNESTGAFVSRQIVDSSGAWYYLHAATLGNYVVVFYASTTMQLINYVLINCTTEVVSASTNVQAGAAVSAARAVFDLVAISPTDVILAWTSNTPNVRVWRMNGITGASVAGPTVVSGETVNAGLAVTATSGEFGAVLYHSTVSGGMRSALFNPATTAQTVAPFAVEVGVAPVNVNCALIRFDATHVAAYWDRDGTGIANSYTLWRTISSAGALGTLIGPLNNAQLISKPYTYGGQFFINVGYPTAFSQNTYFTIQTFFTATPPMAPVATHAYRSAIVIPAWTLIGQLTDVVNTATGAFRFNAAIDYKFLSTTFSRQGISSFTTDLAAPSRLLPVEVNGDTLFANGASVKYDGVSVTENNFLVYPDILTATVSAAAGMDNGTRLYIAIYETSDAKGNTAMSTASVPRSVTTTNGAGNNSVVLGITQLDMTRLGWSTSSQQGVVSLARTINAGTDYYIIQSKKINPVAGTVTFTDTAQDSTITSGRQLYINGGVVDHEPPPPSMHMTLHQGRVWGIMAADRKTVFYSGDIVKGEDVWFSNLQRFRVEPGGDATAVASLDDKLIVFEADRIFKVYGRGLNRLGQNSDIQLPQLISSDVGCIEPRSIAQTPDGIMFLSSKGIYMLTRAEQVVYVGAPVQYWTSNYSSCSSAVMLDDRMEIRFSMSPPVAPLVTPACVDLVYNYQVDAWTTHLKYANKTSVDAISVPGSGYAWAASAGDVYQENATYLDPASTYIVMTLETGWIRPAGLQGFARCGRELFLGEAKDDHGLEVQIAKDYSDVYTMDFRWSRTTLNSIAGEQVGAHLMDQKGEAFRTRISDYSDGGTPGAGYTARGLLLKARTIRAGTYEKLMSTGAKS